MYRKQSLLSNESKGCLGKMGQPLLLSFIDAAGMHPGVVAVSSTKKRPEEGVGINADEKIRYLSVSRLK